MIRHLTLCLLIIARLIVAIEVIFTPMSAIDIVSILERAEYSISICTFSIDEPSIIKSLEGAVKRGVDVKVISETPLYASNIPLKIDAESSLFHLKVILVDQKISIIGSANFTSHSIQRSFNDILIINDPNMGAKFQNFFDDLWNGFFGKIRLRSDDLYATTTNIEETVLCELSKAKKSVDVAMYALTHPSVWATLKILSSKKIRVRLLVDEWFLNNSNLCKLPFTAIQTRVIRDMTLHSKLFIIDGKTVLTGSANATKSGYSRNAEMLIVLKDRNVLKKYMEYFETIWERGEPF